MSLFISLFFIGIFIATYFGVELVRRWSIRKGLLDVPNDRSSHVTPTPRGGGLVIALTTLIAYVLGAATFDYDLSWGYLIGAFLVIGVSLLDDAYSVSIVWRFLIHAIAASALIYDLGYISLLSNPLFGPAVDIGVVGIGLSFIWIVWLINSYNFMDGIDGLAGIQAVVGGLAWLVAGYLSGVSAVVLIGGAVASSSTSFLLHNWAPARIFMGDVGSAFLGFTFAAIPFIFIRKLDANVSFVPFIAIMFVWFFVFDSVFTLIKRLLNGEKIWLGHRQHIYQRLVINGFSHRRVSLVYGLLALIVAIPSAFLIQEMPRLGILVVVLVVATTISLITIYLRSEKAVSFTKSSE